MFKVELHTKEPKPLSWWYDKQLNIDFNPPYQIRGKNWSLRDKAFLVDSILNGYDIPKIYVADFTKGNSPLNVKKKMYAIIDGKQRFEAIFDFFDDNFALDKEFVYEKDRSLDLAGLYYSDLRRCYPSVCRDFDEFSLIVMSVMTNEEDKIQELFTRLNKLSK